MPKTALSITLDQDNLLWLRAQTASGKGKSLSDTLDRLVTIARQAGQVAEGSVRSVAGTIDISDDDPDLASADESVRNLFDRSARLRRAAPERSGAAGVPASDGVRGSGGAKPPGYRRRRPRRG